MGDDQSDEAWLQRERERDRADKLETQSKQLQRDMDARLDKSALEAGGIAALLSRSLDPTSGAAPTDRIDIDQRLRNLQGDLDRLIARRGHEHRCLPQNFRDAEADAMRVFSRRMAKVLDDRGDAASGLRRLSLDYAWLISELFGDPNLPNVLNTLADAIDRSYRQQVEGARVPSANSGGAWTIRRTSDAFRERQEKAQLAQQEERREMTEARKKLNEARASCGLPSV